MSSTTLHVLVVEDDDFQRNIIEDILRSIGVRTITSAANGRQALNLLSQQTEHPIDVAICDLNMPEMDGMEFLRHLGQEHHTVSVILASSLETKVLSSVSRMSEMYGTRVLGTVEKPLTSSNIKNLLLKVRDTSPSPLVNLPQMPRFAVNEILNGIRDGQFVPYLQPKVDMRSGRIIGAEALARWQHPSHGIVSPAAFIPALEEASNIDELTYDILSKATAVLRGLHNDGHMLTMAVNLSLVSLDDTTLADKITRIVRNAGVEPHYLVLEVTESAAMTDIASALENLARLCMQGFVLSIDDFGTGASSLQQLTRIAFSELKIDQSFIKGFSTNPALRIVVESSIDMAHKLSVKSVAEGVETQDDWNGLSAAGCDTVQGYFIARPMDAQAFRDFLNNYKRLSSSPEARSKSDRVTHPSNAHILVVDDDAFTRRIVLQVLHDLGFASVTDTDSASAAIIALANKSFDLVITDVNMPEMNGLQLTQRIRTGKTAAKPETRIVLLSSFSQTEVLASGLALDINGFIVKPIVPAKVDAKLKLALTETMHVRSPLTYEAIKTTLGSLPYSTQSVASSLRGPSVVLGDSKAASDASISTFHVPLPKLRPGMKLKEGIRLNDGTLILSAGHLLTELSINRLRDLSDHLNNREVVIEAFL